MRYVIFFFWILGSEIKNTPGGPEAHAVVLDIRRDFRRIEKRHIRGEGELRRCAQHQHKDQENFAQHLQRIRRLIESRSSSERYLSLKTATKDKIQSDIVESLEILFIQIEIDKRPRPVIPAQGMNAKHYWGNRSRVDLKRSDTLACDGVLLPRVRVQYREHVVEKVRIVVAR